MKQKKRFGWILNVLRYGLLVAAVVFLYYSVKWYDYVALNDAENTLVRVVEEHFDDAHHRTGLVIMRDGKEETVGLDAVVRMKDNPEVPAIQYGIRSVVKHMNLMYAVLALILFGPAWLLLSWRLALMLRIQDVHLKYWPAVKLTYVGNFFNFALPGMTGGDLIKAYYLSQYTHRKTEAVTTVFLDRGMGLLGNVMLASMMILIRWNQVGAQLGWVVLLPAAVGTGMIFGAIVVFNPRIRTLLRLRELVERLPASGQLLRIGRSVLAMWQHKRLVIGSLLLTFVLQGMCYVSAFIMAQALGMKGEFLHYMIFIPIGFMIAAIPFSPPQGFGVMEAAFIWFFTGPALGNSDSQAFALALAARLTQLIWALPGGLVPLLGAHVPRGDELEAFEENGSEGSPSTAAAPDARISPAAPERAT
ncbi:MAG: flippase-like domain-containing protein [Phycisphaerae bacterium]|nr:flippase-like domain-containing protein [Phycisphaerae bacterium]